MATMTRRSLFAFLGGFLASLPVLPGLLERLGRPKLITPYVSNIRRAVFVGSGAGKLAFSKLDDPDSFTIEDVDRAVAKAKSVDPVIKPVRLPDGKDYYVVSRQGFVPPENCLYCVWDPVTERLVSPPRL